MAAVITLTTDFGTADAYVAAMKGVMLGINPAANLVDISHDIRPQDIRQAAYILDTAYPCFPERTIHLAVVDPGVGTARQAVILRTPRADFVAPDNGILSYVIHRYETDPLHEGRAGLRPGCGLQAVAITQTRYWRTPVSNTFHGRDIFAPVAAYLSLGMPLIEFGEEIGSLAAFPVPAPRREPDGSLTGSVLHIDSFGNIITSITSNDLSEDETSVTVTIGGEVIRGLSRSYAAGDGLLALIGSSDRLEVSLKNGDASARLQARVGDVIKVFLQIK